jgi:flagellin
MSVVINTNIAATSAAINFSSSNTALQKSLARLSSGSRIVNPADDAGGLAVSLKLDAAAKRTAAVQTNVANALSFLQTQDGNLKTASDILNRLSELTTLYNDVTKSTGDKSNYQTEFNQLQRQLSTIKDASFNGVSLFGGTALTIKTTEDGSSTAAVSVTTPNLTDTTNAPNFKKLQDFASYSLDGSGSTTAVSLGTVKTAISEIATYRAQNGAYSSRLQFASDILTINGQNLQAANSRIVDADIASESTAYARNQILVQSGASILAQANASAQVALKLIG